MFSHAAFQRVVQQSGLSKYELALLYGVSRQSIYDWLGGQVPKAGGLLSRMADAITTVLSAAITKRTLPMPPVDKRVRKERIARMRVRLEKLPAAPR